MKKHLMIALALLSSTFAYAENEAILVSDLDDTIKVSHVLDVDSVLANTVQVNNSFLGMAELYHSLVQEKKADKIVYLSSAPNLLMKQLHKKFVARSGFPSGTLLLSLNISNRNHKITALRKIIAEDKPRELILVGDNGERDVEIYHQLKTENPELKITTYIHQAYSQIGYERNFGKLLEKDQIGWATSIDLAAQFVATGQLSLESYETLVEKIVPRALVENDYIKRGESMMFPAWFDCRDYVTTSLPTTPKIQSLVVSFEKRLSDRCTREPFSN